VLITPCRDEAQFLQRTIDAVASQTVLPALWVIVDDGSKDDTPQILERAANAHTFIRVIRRADRGTRRVGPGVIEAFYDGLSTIDLDDFDFVCKFDGDLDLPRRYFERVIERMIANSRLGTCSGKPYFPGPDGLLVSEGCGDENSVGMIKFYRTQCFRDFGGFVREVMWDGIDGHRCRMLGWIAESVDDEDLRFVHLRPMGSSHVGILRGRMRHGFGQYFMGTAWWYMLASAVFRMFRPPRIVGGAAMMWGWLRSAIRREARYADPEFRAFLRRFQWQCLTLGKQRAIARMNDEQEAVWIQRNAENSATAPVKHLRPQSQLAGAA
jgi:glycosyltransferase involved in cell wall biosynthesis